MTSRHSRRPSIPLFFSPDPATDAVYVSCRDHGTKREVRELIEALWLRYAPYCPEAPAHFVAEARTQFVPRTWQMYVACALLDAGIELAKPPPKGPDILARVGERQLWIEAVAATPGAGDDAVRPREKRGYPRGSIWTGHPPNEKNVVLRCTSVVRDKLAKIQGYVGDRIVAQHDWIGIAVSTAGIQDADLHAEDMPLIIKAVLPVGEPYLSIPIGGGDARPGVFHRPSIAKNSGAVVPTTLFLREESAIVSFVLYSDVGIWNAPQVLGADIALLHNPMAGSPLPCGTLPFAHEYRAELQPDSLTLHECSPST